MLKTPLTLLLVRRCAIFRSVGGDEDMPEMAESTFARSMGSDASAAIAAEECSFEVGCGLEIRCWRYRSRTNKVRALWSCHGSMELTKRLDGVSSHQARRMLASRYRLWCTRGVGKQRRRKEGDEVVAERNAGGQQVQARAKVHGDSSASLYKWKYLRT